MNLAAKNKEDANQALRKYSQEGQSSSDNDSNK